jgi:hypothetical protein
MDDYREVVEKSIGGKKMIPAKILVLDVLKPHKPNILEFGRTVCTEKSIESANITVYAVDEKTESLKMVLEGKDLDFDKIRSLLENNGAVIHSMDKVVLSRKQTADYASYADAGKI